jgi:UDP-3-O-acyl N-acetylglucosamine deacetylase
MNAQAEFQTTVTKEVEAEGICLHTGVVNRFRLKPARTGHGVVFVRKDLPGSPRIAVSPEAVRRGSLERRTELRGKNSAGVATAEHLLAACLGMGLDNVLVELDGPELPIFDGSVLPYADLIRRAGLTPLDRPRGAWRLLRPVVLIADQAEITALPSGRMELAFFAELRQAGMQNQAADVTLTPEEFERKLAPARTFCFYEEVEKLFATGLIRGGSLDCALVIRDGKPVNGEYRLPNELACHKLVDLIGDLATLGRPVKAFITARGSGHALNHAFIEKLGKELAQDA